MANNKELTPGNLKRLLEDCAQENDKIKGVLKAHKNPTITKVHTVRRILARLLGKMMCP